MSEPAIASTASDSRPVRTSGAQPGNQNATKNRPFAQALTAALAEAEHTRGGRLTLRRIARKVIAMAAQGDIEAVKLLADRLDGKPLQAMDITTRRVDALHESQASDLASAFLEASKRAQLRSVPAEVIDIKPQLDHD